MVFHSKEFVAFLLVVIAAYFALPPRLRWAGLLAASLYFYATSGPIYLLQILAVSACVYSLALRVEAFQDAAHRRRLTTAGVLLLVGNLVVFKYTSFLNETARSVLSSAGVPYPMPVFQALLPLGISFYTFQLISYLVDVSRKKVPAERHPGVFALFVTFFPKIIAGPIERAGDLLPQLHKPQWFERATVVAGLQLMLWGAFKKLVVADRIAPIVSRVYDNPQAHDGVVTAIATWMYAFQIYCDFSGYTDMALGMALLFGYRLSINFDRPYTAISIQDFWKRWHISLTSWLTDYIYTPLTRQKRFKIKFYTMMLIGLFITFVVSGFWHGANWTFVAWGALHGSYLVAALQLRKQRNMLISVTGLASRPRLHHAVKVAVTFNLVCFAYILFRAASIDDALFMMGNLLTGWPNVISSAKAFVGRLFPEFVIGGLGILIVLTAEALKGRVDFEAILAARPVVRWTLYYAGTAAVLLLGAFYGTTQEFIYFRF